jgi:proline iminopeptidase
MHGGGLDQASFRPWVDQLHDRARLIYYDQFGLGQSERPADYSSVDHAAWVDEAEALRRHLDLGRVILLGHSYGGYIALDYALAHPESVAGIILASTAAALDYAPDVLAAAERRSTPEQLRAVHELFHHPDGSPVAPEGPTTDEQLRELWRVVLPVYSNSFAESDAAHFINSSVFSAAGHNHQLNHLIGTYDVSARLGEITVPTLVLCGRHDIVTPPAASERIHRGIKGSELVIFEDSGHFPFAEEPAAFQHAVRRWLDHAVESPPR